MTWASRTAPVGTSTSPEELMAAARASCYAMALSLVLERRGATPENVHVDAVCTLDEECFREVVEEAHRACPVSNAPKDNVGIRVNAAMESAE